ncbi:MAG: DUF86 domain-containing protein [Chloroflexota bacterium]
MSADRHVTDYLRDMISGADAAMAFVQGVDFDTFERNLEKSFAVVWALEIVGEAARNVHPSVRRQYPAVPWRHAIDMRNFVSHQYFGVDLEVVWRTVHADLPSLRAQVASVLEDINSDDRLGS